MSSFKEKEADLIYIHGCTTDEIVTVVGNRHSTRVQILDKALCISYGANTLRKGWIQQVSLQLWVICREDWPL